MHRSLILPLSAFLTVAAIAQERTKEGYALAWNKEIVTGHDSIPSGALKVPATTVPVFEARANDVAALLKSALPMAAFKVSNGVYSAPSVNLSNLMPSVDVLATAREDRKAGMTTVAFAFMQNGVPVGADAGVVSATARDIGVKMNKAVAQRQVDVWQAKLDKATKQQEGAQADKEKAYAKVSKANQALEKTVAKRSGLQKEIANAQADITRQEVRWQTSQDPKDLKKLTKLREKLAKSEKKLADAMADEAKQSKAAHKHQDDLPDAMKDHEKVAGSREEVQRTVDALKRKVENIR